MQPLVYNDTGIEINASLASILAQVNAQNTTLDTLTTNWGLWADKVTSKFTSHASRLATLEAFYDAIDNLSTSENGAIMHNMFYRGKNLGSAPTSTQQANIANGTFKGIFVGDYWEKSITYKHVLNGAANTDPDATNTETLTKTVRMVVMHCDYAYDMYRQSDRATHHITTHHVAVMPRECLFANYYHRRVSSQDVNTECVGYLGSDIYNTYMVPARAAFDTFFGSSRILTHWERLSTLLAEGNVTSGLSDVDVRVELPQAMMCTGTLHESEVYIYISNGTMMGKAVPQSYNNSIGWKQFAAFHHNRQLLSLQTVPQGTTSNALYWWTRDVFSPWQYLIVAGGITYNIGESMRQNSFGVRPYAFVY